MSAKKLENRLDSAKKGHGNVELGDLVARARALGELTETLAKALGEELATGLVAANLRDDNTLVLVAQSPAWAARLRFEEQAVLAAAAASALNVDRVSVRVARVDYNSDG